MDFSQITLHTPRLILRELNPGDASAVHAYDSDPRAVAHQSWGPNTLTQTEEFLSCAMRWRNEQPRIMFELAIIEVESGELIGNAGLNVQSLKYMAAGLGYTLRPDKWSQGYGFEAAQALSKFGFETLGLHRIWATVSPFNLASIKILEKLGMQREGCMRDYIWVRGQWWDMLLYAILDRDTLETP